MMRATLLTAGLLLGACASAATQPPPSLSPAKTAGAEAEAMPELDLPPAPVKTSRILLTKGRLTQGGLSFWRTTPGSAVTLDGERVSIDSDGHFVLGFERDHEGPAELTVRFPSGEEETKVLNIADRDFNIQRIDNLPESKVNPYTDEQLAQIREESRAKKEARQNRSVTSYWRAGFAWPVDGRFTGKYGDQRILNGTPKRFHSGLDLAAPPGTTPMEFQGTDVRAPSTGRITLAESDFHFEGGLILIDHGQEIESAMLHLSRVDVKPGQVVTKGEVIGAVGMTGRATGPHLHWTVNWKGKPMDPELLLPPRVSLGR
jgi:murein DD-endopeptidase MepM/ murein hydrolase activator NlpD